MSILPPPADASRVSCFLADHPRWSAYWNKKHGLWRVAEDDPDSDLYAESNNADTVLGYIEAHAREVDQPRIMPALCDRLPGGEIERFGMGPAVMLGQGLTKVAGPVCDGAVTDLAEGDWKMGNGHRGTAGRRLADHFDDARPRE